MSPNTQVDKIRHRRSNPLVCRQIAQYRGKTGPNEDKSASVEGKNSFLGVSRPEVTDFFDPWLKYRKMKNSHRGRDIYFEQQLSEIYICLVWSNVVMVI